MFGHFYNESLRKLVIGFGGLFDSIQIYKYNIDGSTKSKIQIPLSYGPRVKFRIRIRHQSSSADDINKP